MYQFFHVHALHCTPRVPTDNYYNSLGAGKALCWQNIEQVAHCQVQSVLLYQSYNFAGLNSPDHSSSAPQSGSVRHACDLCTVHRLLRSHLHLENHAISVPATISTPGMKYNHKLTLHRVLAEGWT